MADRGGDVTRLLVAGAGLIGARHIAHIRAHKDMTLTGVIDPVAKGADFACIEDVTADADGIIIASPTQTHRPILEHAAGRGWHALVEKPLATELAEIDAMIAAARDCNIALMVGHHRRFHPRVQALKAIVESGEIGQPVLASAIWSVKKPDDYFDVHWRKGVEGAPVRMNVSHEIDLLRFLFGDVSQVVAVGANNVRRAPRVESGAVALGCERGGCATVAFADTAPSVWGFEHATGENPNIATTRQDSLRITGTKGAVAFPSLRVWTGAADWSEAPAMRVADAEDGVPLVQQLEHFADVIAGRATPLNDGKSGRRTHEITLEIERAVWPKEVFA